MAKQSKATKAVIASLLATSAIVPAMAVSAADATTPATAKTIDFKLEDTMGGILSKYITSPGALVELQGKQYIQVTLPDAVLSLVKTVTVNGTSIINDKKQISVPLTADYAPVKIELETSLGNITATVTPDKSSIKGGEEKTEEAKPAVEGKPFTPGKKFESVADGTYDVTIDAYDPEKNVGGYAAITPHLSTNAKLVVKEGKYKLQVSPSAASNAMIAGFKINDKELTAISGSPTGEVQVFEIELDSISELYKASVHVVVKAANMDKWYPFGIAINTADLELPKAGVKEETKPEPTSKTMPVSVYKDGTKETSFMQGKYLADTVTVTATEGGYDVDVTFPEGQHLNDFTVEGATVALKSEEVVGANTVKIYTVSVADLSKLYTAAADLTVKLNGEILYEEI
ncbi:MAG: NEAT domain-containing protein, partial [Kurthia sp.]|nr:NEAT domain-containing protein [Candidatus Kurthia equi]